MVVLGLSRQIASLPLRSAGGTPHLAAAAALDRLVGAAAEAGAGADPELEPGDTADLDPRLDHLATHDHYPDPDPDLRLGVHLGDKDGTAVACLGTAAALAVGLAAEATVVTSALLVLTKDVAVPALIRAALGGDCLPSLGHDPELDLADEGVVLVAREMAITLTPGHEGLRLPLHFLIRKTDRLMFQALKTDPNHPPKTTITPPRLLMSRYVGLPRSRNWLRWAHELTMCGRVVTGRETRE